MTGKITWFEVLGTDTAALAAFYSGIFGWKLKVQQTPVGPYAFTEGEQTGVPGGVGPAPGGKGWTTFYVEVDSIEDTIAKATAQGGSVLMPPTNLPDTRIAVIADPEGHPMGLTQSLAA